MPILSIRNTRAALTYVEMAEILTISFLFPESLDTLIAILIFDKNNSDEKHTIPITCALSWSVQHDTFNDSIGVQQQNCR